MNSFKHGIFCFLVFFFASFAIVALMYLHDLPLFVLSLAGSGVALIAIEEETHGGL